MDYTGKIISKNPPQPTQASASGVWTLDEAAAAVRNNNWPIVGVPNPISKSLRFNSADSAYLNRTPASASNRKTWTWSGWVKRCSAGANHGLLAGIPSEPYVNQITSLTLGSSNDLVVQDYIAGSYNLVWNTSAVFRDPSAWYHIVCAYDTTQASSANAVKLYVNNVQQTITFTAYTGSYVQNRESFINNTNPNILGRYVDTGYLNGYMTEVYLIDGQALTPSSFGQTNPNTGVWEPIRYTGTYGTNGFYLNFKDSATTTALGYDYSGNGNNWTPNNFSVTAGAGNDSLTDVPTSWTAYTVDNVDSGGVVRGNYCTLNPLSNLSSLTLANGNLDGSRASASWASARATFGMSSGKWYWEVTPITGISPGSTTNQIMIGISLATASSAAFYDSAGGWGYYYNDGNKWNNNSGAAYGSSYTNNDVIGVAFDADSGELKFYKNGTVQNSGTAAYTGLTSGPYFPTIALYGTSSFVTNFGQRPFAYNPPTGFKSLCTTNLPTPVIGATSTTQADDYFNAVTYTGNNTTNVITVGFQPDLSWVKRRDSGNSHNLADVIRGATNGLASNSTSAAYTLTGFDSFISTGFQLAADTSNQVNANGGTYVSWNWKAGGTGVSNTTGSISSTVSANSDAGFSVVTYTGNGSTGTIGHGCKVNNVATAPSMIIIKVRSTTNDWGVGHASVGWSQAALLNLTNAFGASSYFNSTAPTSTVFSVGNNSVTNANGATYVAYCFAPVAGYSAFGSYTGNASTDGPFVYTGFRPRFIFGKDSGGTNNWWIFDSARDTYNVAGKILRPNLSDAELDSPPRVDLLSNGFKIRTTGLPNDATTNIYAAFAESPFKYALAR